ncbi:MAG: YkgJ family cysteine cluster protein [Desulfovibrio sp.]|nr:YkgJ family cysteine cluster protein [Desulfovibrio sp.]
MCGDCCKGKGGIVVSPTDLVRLVETLGLPTDDVIAKYCEKSGSKLKIKIAEDGYCVFFKEGKGCTVHAGKPSVCKAWPFFRGNLIDETSFLLAKEYCPGINPHISHKDFCREALSYLRANNLLATDSEREANALILS